MPDVTIVPQAIVIVSMRALLPVLVLLLADGTAPAVDLPREQPPQAGASQEASRMKVRIKLEGRSMTATLENSEAGRDFLSMLPVTLTLADYNSAEKIADLPRSCPPEAHPRVSIRRSATSPATRRGETAPSSTATSDTRALSSSSAGSTPESSS
jgi:hypothetical protein